MELKLHDALEKHDHPRYSIHHCEEVRELESYC